MRVTQVGYALGVAAAVALFAGCSGSGSSMNSIAPAPGMGQQSVVVNHVPTVMPAAVMKSMHFAGAYRGASHGVPNLTGAVVMGCSYPASACAFSRPGSNHNLGTISGLSNPQGVGVDRAGNFYVANTGASNVLEFAKGGTTPIATLTDTGNYPVDVAVAANGTVYVANIFTTSFTAGNVTVFPAGHTTPTRTITDPHFFQVISDAVDEHNELVVCYNASAGGGSCDEFVHASGHGTTVTSGYFFSGGSAFDAAGNFYANDQTVATNVYTSAFAACNSYNLGYSDQLMMNLDRSNGDLYQADAGHGYIQEQTNSGCTGTPTLEHDFTAGFFDPTNPPYGVAVSPGTSP
jgi:hypothetical protein